MHEGESEMLSIGTVADAVRGGRRRAFEGGKFQGYTDFMFETQPHEVPGPQAFLVHQAANWTLPLHFHMHYQMQVVVGGGGTLGPHDLKPGVVHYASPQAAYGPLISGPDGLEYFTLRARSDRGAWYLPESRSHMQRGMRKEQLTGAPSPSAASHSERVILPLREDGLGAWLVAASRGETILSDHEVSPAGRFHVVLEGEFRSEGILLPRLSCVYWAPEGRAPEFECLSDQGSLVVVQFPRQARDHQVSPDVLLAAPRQASVPMSA